MIKKISVLVFICVVFSQQVLALGLTMSERQLNSILDLRFPITQTYMEYYLEATEPYLALYATTQSVAITAKINVINNGNRLIANTTFKGQIFFDKASNSLKVSNPLITKFEIIENTFPKSEASINAIKNTIGQHLPISVLIDFDHISNELFQFSPSSLRIVAEGLRVEF
ncbi:hypothetical protein [Colwellia sp. PAMC 21821]|uniref:hypothetical protein n=1 Tax=Colwellia sp. PAMC 21821 TaxID=1816219 RepID=UPI0009BF8E7A|nr:hypothetical protein [Colwellia sp. PAMC 21821]ARD44215.1 hypothetical protein A3Q33_07750 [Colwellia sp. PAMC 21821]